MHSQPAPRSHKLVNGSYQAIRRQTTYRENCAREPILVKENTAEESFAEHFQDQKETESYSTNGEMVEIRFLELFWIMHHKIGYLSENKMLVTGLKVAMKHHEIFKNSL